jgi:hypothetical protein
MVSLKNPALDFQVSGSWVGFAVDQTTRTVVKEIYSPHGSYLLEIHNPRADEKGIYYIWGIWHTANSDVFVQIKGSSNPTLFDPGDQIVMRDVAVENGIMTYRDEAGKPWIYLRISG